MNIRTERIKRALLFAALLLLLAAGGWLFWQYTHTVRLPVLMYHHFDRTSDSFAVVSEARLEEQLRTLAENGYHAVTVEQVRAYVEDGTALPEKPVLITLDDGYQSNLDIAAPILRRYGLRAAVFVVGHCAGDDRAGESMTPPRFALRDALPWMEAGVLEVQSHSFAMHEDKNGYHGMLPQADRTAASCREAMDADCAAQRNLFLSVLGEAPSALAYPYGACTEETDDIVAENGIAITFTTKFDTNYLRMGDSGCLRRLSRFTVDESQDGEALLRLVRRGGIRTLWRHAGDWIPWLPSL